MQVDALMNSLEEIRSQDPSVKCIVVSQFTSFLNLIQIPLRRARFKYTRIDGGMRQQDRANSINDFNSREEDTPTIMLLSLNAGGVGLTLTTATKVFLMDPVRFFSFVFTHRLVNNLNSYGQVTEAKFGRVRSNFG